MIHGGNVWQGTSPEQWLDYSANIRPEGAPNWVKDALLGAMDKLPYYPDQEMKRARQALSAYLDLPAEFVLPTAGGISAIDLATHLPGTGMLQFTPCFAEYSMLSGNRGKSVGNIPFLTGRNIIGDPAEQAKDRLFEGCTVWLCNPLNPIGCAFRVEQIERLLALVEEKHGWLVVDEAFIDYCPEHSVRDAIAGHPALIVLGSLTKVLAVPGVRLGYLAAHPPVIEDIREKLLPWRLNCVADAVAAALPGHKADFEQIRRLNDARRADFAAALAGIGARVYPSDANFLLCDFGRDMRPAIEGLREEGILIRPCGMFPGLTHGHVRLCVRTEGENGLLTEALRKCLESNTGA